MFISPSEHRKSQRGSLEKAGSGLAIDRVAMLRHTGCHPIAVRFLLTAPLAITVVLTLASRGICAEAATQPNQGCPSAIPYQPEPLNDVTSTVPPASRLAQPVPPPSAKRKWYGYQLMLDDAASIALIAGTAGKGAAISLGELSFFFGGSVIHGVHRRAGLALASPLMRVSLVLIGARIGVAAEHCGPTNDDFSALGGALLGGGIGLLTAMMVDYSLAWTDESPNVEDSAPPFETSRSPRVSFTSAGLAPLRDGGASVVLGGQF